MPRHTPSEKKKNKQAMVKNLSFSPGEKVKAKKISDSFKAATGFGSAGSKKKPKKK